MASFVNKIVSSVTNNTSTIIGRENMTKISNSLNRTFKQAKYRDFLKSGNVIQLISKTSHNSLQICASQNDPNRLILLGNGQIGEEFFNAHFTLIRDKNDHLKFQNRLNFLACDEPGIPCVLSEPTKPKPKPYEYIRARNEFRLHEIIGSEEWFALESVYFPGRYISITPEGGITVSKNKAEDTTHFCLHIIHVHQTNMRQPNRPQAINNKNEPLNGPAVQVIAANDATNNRASASSEITSDESSRNAAASRQKEQESKQNEESNRLSTEETNNTPPAYGSLFPQLPK